MGIEFIRKAAPAFRKRWDRDRLDLGTPTLFTQQPGCNSYSAIAGLRGGVSVEPGDNVTVQQTDRGVVAYKGAVEVGVFAAPTPDLLNILAEGYGIAPGRVEHVHPLAQAADIKLCL